MRLRKEPELGPGDINIADSGLIVRDNPNILDTAQAAMFLETSVGHMKVMRCKKCGPEYTRSKDLSGRPYYLYRREDLKDWRSKHKKRAKRTSKAVALVS